MFFSLCDNGLVKKMSFLKQHSTLLMLTAHLRIQKRRRDI
tara:strand:+ start:472 stop:591 length:120 start_codon:yes stop_codon:yes gene_type:complete